MWERWERPGEHQGEVEVIGRIFVIAESDDGIFNGEQHARVDVEGEVKVERTTATFLGVQVHLPHLTQRVGLHEVPFVMYVEPVIDGVILELGYVTGDVDSCHGLEDSGGVALRWLGCHCDHG